MSFMTKPVCNTAQADSQNTGNSTDPEHVMAPTRMQIAIPQPDVDDLRHRLAAARWPVSVEGYGWDDGTDGTYLREFISYWRDQYDWRHREAQLNRFQHFQVEIDGELVHYLLAPGTGPRRMPLLLLHGWPSSFVQMLDILPLLTRDAGDGTVSFDVVVAALPGYPFTRLPTRPGASFGRIGELMVRLMTEVLGHSCFAGRGSDQGGLVLQRIGLRHPHCLIGLHRSGITPFANPLPNDLSPEEVAYQQCVSAWAARETAYARLQALRPETLVPALADSPVALASWFLEKFQRWGDCRNGLDAAFGRDRLIDNLCLHWFTRSAASATRLYREAVRDSGLTGRVEVPTAIMMPLKDGVTVPAPRAWCERTYNVQRWTVTQRGGHFPEWETPDVVAQDIRAFFTAIADQRITGRDAAPANQGALA
jgi:pimeloyl-ACP methyl ester carboxylesterase